MPNAPMHANCMSAALATMVLFALAPLVAADDPLTVPDLSKATPIIGQVVASDRNAIFINNKWLSATEMGDLLQDIAEKFGPNDPILLYFSDDTTLARAFFWIEKAKETHKYVWAIAYAKDGSLPVFLFAPKAVSKQDEVEDLGVPNRKPTNTVPQRPGPLTVPQRPGPLTVPQRPGPLVPVKPLPTGSPPQYKGCDVLIPPPKWLLELIEQEKYKNPATASPTP